MSKEVIEALYEILNSEMAIDTSGIDPDALLAPLADTDDWSFIFIPEVETRFGINPSMQEWREAGSLNEVARLILKCSSKQ
jgi:hypothetical protein